MSGGYYYSEMMGSGVALFDADGDGDLDLFLVQGTMLGSGSIETATFPPPAHGLGDRLYLNRLETGELRFEDVSETALAGLEPGYGMGVAAADFDGDGRTDLYLTRTGTNVHLRNVPGENGVPRFVDVSDGVTGSRRWGVPAVPGDFDGDGDIDLFVGNYVDYSVSTDRRCPDELGQPNYCGPLSYPPVADQLFVNRGDGTFEDGSVAAGLAGIGPGVAFGACLGAVAADFDGDGRLDLYVANDGNPNQLWINIGKGASGGPRFENRAVESGVAVNGRGQAEASMGVAVADVDRDGDEDIFLTHLSRETHTLYRNDGSGFFDDRSSESGLGAPSFDRTGFGAVFLDHDRDGLPDLATVTGTVKVIKELSLAGDPHPLHQPDQLFRGVGGGRFEEVESAVFRRSEVGRGLAVGDLDNDGDPDLVVSNNAGPARVLENRGAEDVPWVGLRLVNAAGSDVPGALATIEDVEGVSMERVGANASYASASDPRLLFALNLGGDGSDGGSPEPGTVVVRITWPDGLVERFEGVPTDRYSTLRRAEGSPVSGGVDR